MTNEQALELIETLVCQRLELYKNTSHNITKNKIAMRQIIGESICELQRHTKTFNVSVITQELQIKFNCLYE